MASCLHVTTRRSFWAFVYQPRGNQSSHRKTLGRRHAPRARRRHADGPGRGPHRGHDGQGARPAGSQPLTMRPWRHALTSEAARAALS